MDLPMQSFTTNNNFENHTSKTENWRVYWNMIDQNGTKREKFECTVFKEETLYIGIAQGIYFTVDVINDTDQSDFQIKD